MQMCWNPFVLAFFFMISGNKTTFPNQTHLNFDSIAFFFARHMFNVDKYEAVQMQIAAKQNRNPENVQGKC